MSGPAPAHFFAQELAGEEPLSLETARRLYALAGQFWALRPWKTLDETQLIMIEDSTRQRHTCSVMGSAGEYTALAVHLGVKGYAFFETIHQAASIHPGEFLALQHSVSVEFDWPSELTKPDRELLRAFGYTRSKGHYVPLFRAVRPGYHPWYVTQGEGELLAEGLRATNALVEMLPEGDPDRFWQTAEKYPLLVRGGAGATGEPVYRVEMASPPRAKETPLAHPQLDEARLARILEARFSRHETLELDQFWGASPVGEKKERKACLRGAAAINAITGYAYPPRIVSPEVPVAELLADVLLSAIEAGGFLPRRVRVRNAGYQQALQPLAHLLGFELTAAAEMPALDFFKDGMLAAMGERGPILL